MTATEGVWVTPPANLTLESNEVHVWLASLSQPAGRMQSLLHTLSPDELEKAERFHFSEDYRRFVVARGVLRAILSRYLQTSPVELRFSYNPYGKPFLTDLPSQNTPSFNLSHSGELVLISLACGRRVGVDLERVRSLPDAEQIAKRFFSDKEYEVFREVSVSRNQEDVFFTCWTRKEAYIKARGDGLSMPLNSFDVSLLPGEPATLLNTREDPHEASRWTLEELVPSPGYVAALAVEGRGWRLRCWQWPK